MAAERSKREEWMAQKERSIRWGCCRGLILDIEDSRVA